MDPVSFTIQVHLSATWAAQRGPLITALKVQISGYYTQRGRLLLFHSFIQTHIPLLLSFITDVLTAPPGPRISAACGHGILQERVVQSQKGLCEEQPGRQWHLIKAAAAKWACSHKGCSVALSQRRRAAVCSRFSVFTGKRPIYLESSCNNWVIIELEECPGKPGISEYL